MTKALVLVLKIEPKYSKHIKPKRVPAGVSCVSGELGLMCFDNWSEVAVAIYPRILFLLIQEQARKFLGTVVLKTPR